MVKMSMKPFCKKTLIQSSTSSLVGRLLSFYSQSRKLCQPLPPTYSDSVIHGNSSECETNTHSCVLYYILVISLITMVKTCSWVTCNSDTRYPERVQNVRFIPFPKPTTNGDKCLRWIKSCGRPHWQFNQSKINRHTFVCSKVSGFELNK